MTRTLTLIAAILSTLAISCKKTDTILFRQFKPDVKNCQVVQIVHSPCCQLSDTMVFTYNQLNDPVSITRLPSPSTGAPNYLFKYDKKRRLTDIIGAYQDGSAAEFWHKYFYANPGNGDIVLDSTFYFVRVQNGMMISYYYAAATYFAYDKQGRIVKDSMIFNREQFATVNTYIYAADGNLVGRVYDTKTNIHQTNKIWMFFDRDYSVNNPVIAETYNNAGLPTRINLVPESGGFFRFITGLHNPTFSYTCDSSRR